MVQPKQTQIHSILQEFPLGTTCEDTQTLLEKMQLKVLTVTMDPKCTGAPPYHIITLEDEREAKSLMALAKQSKELTFEYPSNDKTNHPQIKEKDLKWETGTSSSQRRRAQRLWRQQQRRERKRESKMRPATNRSLTDNWQAKRRPPRQGKRKPMSKASSRQDGKLRIPETRAHTGLSLQNWLKVILLTTLCVALLQVPTHQNLHPQLKKDNKQHYLCTQKDPQSLNCPINNLGGTKSHIVQEEKTNKSISCVLLTKKGRWDILYKEIVENKKGKKKRKPYPPPTIWATLRDLAIEALFIIRLLFKGKSNPIKIIEQNSEKVKIEMVVGKKTKRENKKLNYTFEYKDKQYTTLQIKKVWTVDKILGILKASWELNHKYLRMVYKGGYLAQEDTMDTHNIPTNSTIQIVDNIEEIQNIANNSVFINNSPEPTIKIQINQKQAILQVKRTICNRTQINENEFYLEYKGKYLQDNKYIEDYCIQPYSTIKVIHRGPGGTQNEEPPKPELKIATINLGCKHKNYKEIKTEADKHQLNIIAIQETGCTSSEIGPPQPEAHIKVEGYHAVWNNPTAETLLKNSKRNALDNTQRKDTLTPSQRDRKVRDINSKTKAKARGGTGFLIQNNMKGCCYFKTYNKKKLNGKTTPNTRMLLLKVKREGTPTMYLLNLYLPAAGKAANEKFCNKYLAPLLEKWDKKGTPVTIMGDMNTKLKQSDRWSTKPIKQYTLKHTLLTNILQHPTTPWKDLYSKFSKELKFTRHANINGHEVHTRIDHIIANNEMKSMYTGCDIEELHNLDTDHNWVMASLQMDPSTKDLEYLKVDEESSTRKYKDKNITEETKTDLMLELDHKWPHIQLKLKPFNQQNIQKITQKSPQG